MHHTREEAEAERLIATTKPKGDGAPAESREVPADVPAVGGKDSDTDDSGEPAESQEIQANTYTGEVAQWLASLASKASERGVLLPTILIEMCPSP